MIRPIEKNNCYRFLSIVIFTLAFINASYAQKNNPLINSGDLLKKGIDLHDAGKYQEAIQQYSQISRSDTNYSDALYEMAYSYAEDSQFDIAYQYSLKGMQLFPDQLPRFGMQAANTLDDMKKPADAITLYD